MAGAVFAQAAVLLVPAPPDDAVAALAFGADDRSRGGGREAALVRVAALWFAVALWFEAALWFAVALGGPVTAGALVDAWGLVVDLAPCARNGTIA
jgi:hypothetical protein